MYRSSGLDQVINCKGCGKDFVFTEREQNFFKEHNYLPPKRCFPCRKQRRLKHGKSNIRANTR